MENETTQATQSEQTILELPNESQFYLWETRKWGNFFGILGFTIVGLIVLASLTVLVFSPSLIQMSGPLGASSMIAAVLYLLIALLYFYPALYIYRFAKHMKLALQTKNTSDLNEAFKNLKSNFRYMGILMCIVLGFYAVILIFGLAIGLNDLLS